MPKHNIVTPIRRKAPVAKKISGTTTFRIRNRLPRKPKGIVLIDILNYLERASMRDLDQALRVIGRRMEIKRMGGQDHE